MASQQQNLSQNRSVQDKRQRDSRQAPEVDDILKEQRTRRRPVSHVKWSEMEQNLSEEVVKFSNCWVFRDGELIWDELWVQNGVIIDPMKRFWEASNNTEFACDVVVDCEGQILSPGFIDLQLNGAYGIDISNPGVTEEQITYIAQRILRHGCTAFLPTVVTSSPSTYRHVLPKLAPRCYWPHGKEHHRCSFPSLSSMCTSSQPHAMILGAHLEGPFIAYEKRGAHAPEYIRSDVSDPNLEEVYGSELRSPLVRVVTLAPELKGALEATKNLCSRGVIVSMGHSSSNVKVAEQCFRCGSSMITHLFNAMRGFHHRDPGLIGMLGRSSSASLLQSQNLPPACPSQPSVINPNLPVWGSRKVQSLGSIVPLCSRIEQEQVSPQYGHMPLSEAFKNNQNSSDSSLETASDQPLTRPYFGLIADGIHCHPYSVVIAYNVHPEGLFLVTDGIAALGLEPGTHCLGSMEIEIESTSVPMVGDDGAEILPSTRAVLKDTDTLAGAIAPLDQCVRNFRSFTRCSVAECLRAATEIPAKALGLYDQMGDLSYGKRADLVLLSERLSVNATYLAGKLHHVNVHSS
eukprot:gb/GECG01008562.1/.p1 GENE.gb/GECG01008562.1/~~gb/GECG01008562.1/.p1  ORF type:complete len:575 (+),score=44.39 gb/GECG01008562.1/:1-1725(+)